MINKKYSRFLKAAVFFCIMPKWYKNNTFVQEKTER
jgi:hypothetical protein